MSYEFQELHYAEGQLFTTFHGIPEKAVVTLDMEQELDPPLLHEMVKRFNAYPQMVALLKDYVEDDVNNDMDETELSMEAQALLTELGEME